MKGFFQLISSRQFTGLLESFTELPSETILLTESLGRFPAHTITSPEALPPFPRSTMDGYAVRAQDTFGCSESEPALLQIVGEISMGSSNQSFILNKGQATAIWTGGELPDKADAVIMVEYTNSLDETTIEVFKGVAPGENVIQAGEDIAQSAVVITKGNRLRPQDLGLLAGLGLTELEVFRKPVVGIISTGDELVTPDTKPGPGQIRDINTTTLSSLVMESGGIPRTFGIIKDDFNSMLKVCNKALDTPVDILLLSGGSSVGNRDFTLSVFQSLKETTMLAHGVAIRPGKPTLLAQRNNCALFGLPGHVASTIVVYYLFVRYLILRFSGVENRSLASIAVQTGEQIPSVIGREDYVRVRLIQRPGSIPEAFPIYGKSGLLKPLIAADGLLRIDRDCEGLNKGEQTEVLLFP
jgi:molybdopterin molybdotransferase